MAPQSHIVITTLRSIPCGRSGRAKGSSPAAMRSVQSAKSESAFLGPSRDSVSAMFAIAWPDWTRRSHASVESLNSPSSGESRRTPLEPSAWQDWHEFLMVSIQACWVLISGPMPLPPSPVPGNSLFCRNLQHRIPVDTGIILGRGGGVGRGHRAEVQQMARRALLLRRIDQAIAPHPDAVICLRQVRHEIAPAIIGDHDLGEFGREIRRLGDHPDPGLGSVQSADDAAQIARADMERRVRLLRHGGAAAAGPKRERGQRDRTDCQAAFCHRSLPRVRRTCFLW